MPLVWGSLLRTLGRPEFRLCHVLLTEGPESCSTGLMGSFQTRHLSESCDFTELTGTGCMTNAAPANTFERESIRSSWLTYCVCARMCSSELRGWHSVCVRERDSIRQIVMADIPCVCMCVCLSELHGWHTVCVSVCTHTQSLSCARLCVTP